MASKSVPKSVITFTFGDMAENHKGMEQLGQLVEEGEGFNHEDLLEIKETFETQFGGEAQLYDLARDSKYKAASLPHAYLLVLKGGLFKFLGEMANEEIFEEQMLHDYDKKAFMYGRVVNKHARWNLCFDDESSEPNYKEKKGRVVGFSEVPLLARLKEMFEEYFGPKAENLKIESNYYYDVTKCGIGYHGDSERRKVIGLRVGDIGIPIYYQWFFQGVKIGDRLKYDLDVGDIYIMSEKAVGTDWTKKIIPTLRHAVGCEKFITHNK